MSLIITKAENGHIVEITTDVDQVELNAQAALDKLDEAVASMQGQDATLRKLQADNELREDESAAIEPGVYVFNNMVELRAFVSIALDELQP